MKTSLWTRWTCLFRTLLPLFLLCAGHAARAEDNTDRFQALYDAGKYAEAEKFAAGVLAGQSGANARATWMHNLAMAFDGQSKYREAEPMYRQSLALLEGVLGKEHPNVALSLSNLGNTEMQLGKFSDSEAHHRRALAIRERAGGPNNPEIISNLVGLAGNFQLQGRHAEAEPWLLRTLKLLETVLPKEDAVWATVLSNLGANFQAQGRFAEAEATLKRALTIRERVQGPRHPELVGTLNNLGNIYQFQGNSAEAEAVYRRAIQLAKEVLTNEDSNLEASLQNLGVLTASLSRFDDATKAFTEALAICEKSRGKDHPNSAAVLSGLADLERRQGRFPQAEAQHRRALAIYEKAFGRQSSAVARELSNLAILANLQERHDEAQSLRDQALSIWTAIDEADQPHVMQHYEWTGIGHLLRKQFEPALAAMDRALELAQRYPSFVEQRSRLHHYRAKAFWELGRRDEALAEVQKAFDLLDQQRPQTAGTEQEHAVALSNASGVVDVAVAWNAELGKVADAFTAIERTRARGLSDQMQLQGADLLAGLPPAQADALRKRDEAARLRVASLQSRVKAIADWSGDLADAKKQELPKAEAALRQAEQDYVAVYRDIRAASPVLRLASGSGRTSASIGTVQQWLAQRKGLLLEYHIGDEDSFVVIIPAEGEARIVKLELNADQAREFQVEAGALTMKKAQAALSFENRDLTSWLSSPETAEKALPRLATLWNLLIPDAERALIQEGKIGQLVIVPDGPLAVLPFETLVVEPGEDPKYLLDVGPPVSYAPSATILLSLTERKATPTPADLKPVLTVGDPVYAPGAVGVGTEARPRARYSAMGGRLQPLPFSGTESSWVASVFSEAGIPAGRLVKDQATEKAVRYNLPGRQIVHLACHGLVDQKYGNLFGALALTPGANAATNLSDDGFLTLAEIYALDLRSCELSILSACQTNFGPLQQGEGVWALSRGFLVAGSRRVVASNWLVDDEAAATLTSYLCGGIARDQAKKQIPDHAARLHSAKRAVRAQKKWSSPYYWATFVLIGPPQ